MKGHHTNLDLEIASAEVRIEYHRRQLQRRKELVREAVRARLASPGMLLTAAGAGFMLGALGRSGGGKRGTQRGPLRSLWTTLLTAVTAALKFAQTGPVVWLASTIGASHAREQRETVPRY